MPCRLSNCRGWQRGRFASLRENRLVVREEIAVATARLIANPVAHKLKAEAIDTVLGRLRGR